MRYTLILALILTSLNSFAGYECHLSLFQTHDLDSVVFEKTFFADDKDMKMIVHKDFITEHQEGNKKINIDLKSLTVGWRGEEEVTLSAFRNNQKIGEKVFLRGDDKNTLWFDSYKLEIECMVI